ncbi:MAG: methyl-accepting chemotaxis protein [Nitrospirae bacterium]|nr:methyl-accepting chemotaxis protein [Nitrospirota bacterium]
MERTYKRRQYIVDKDFQGRFILTFVLICLFGMVMAVGLFNYFALNELEDLRWSMAFYENSLASTVTPHLIYLSIFSVLFTIVSLSMASWFIAGKVAGPIYRLKKDIESIGDGNLYLNVRLRKADMFKDTAQELDSMATALRERFKNISKEFNATRKIIDTLKDTKDELLKTKCEQLSYSIENLSNTLKT